MQLDFQSEIAAAFERAIRYAAMNSTDAAEIHKAITSIPVGPLADYLEDRDWHHDANTLDSLRAAHFGELVDGEYLHVAQHPTSGKAVAWRDAKETPWTVAELEHRLPEQGLGRAENTHDIFHGPGGLVSAWHALHPSDRSRGIVHYATRHNLRTGDYEQTFYAGPSKEGAYEAAKRVAFPTDTN